jgi:hypothetical protein
LTIHVFVNIFVNSERTNRDVCETREPYPKGILAFPEAFEVHFSESVRDGDSRALSPRTNLGCEFDGRAWKRAQASFNDSNFYALRWSEVSGLCR